MGYVELFGRDLSPAVVGRIAEVRKELYGTTARFAGVIEGYESYGAGAGNFVHVTGLGTANARPMMPWSPEHAPDDKNTRVFLWEG